MRITRIEPQRTFQIIVRGTLDQVVQAVGHHSPRPIALIDPQPSTVAIHAALVTDRAMLDRWWADSAGSFAPGTLCWFRQID